MKREQIILDPHVKNILLGVFFTDTFKWAQNNLPIWAYGRFDRVIEGYINWEDVLDTVERAAKAASKIVFVLDQVYFPIDLTYHTCRELKLICENDELFNKTIFVKGENIVTFDKNLVI